VSEAFGEIAEMAERAVAGSEVDKKTLVRLLRDTDIAGVGEPEDRAYLAVLLDWLGMREQAMLALHLAGSEHDDHGARMANLEGMLASRHAEYDRARELFGRALSAAGDGTSLRAKILANLAALSLITGEVRSASAWLTQVDNVGRQASDPATDVLLASTRFGIAREDGDLPGLREAVSQLSEATRATVAELGSDHPLALTAVASLAAAEFELGAAEESVENQERAIAVLEVTAHRLAADLGAYHPQALTCLKNLCVADLRLAQASGSKDRAQRAVYALESVSQRIENRLANPGIELEESFPADDRAARIAEIFGMIDALTGDNDRQINLCREALALMTTEEAASPAAGWLEFVAGKALVRRTGPDRVADLTAAIVSFQAALARWTPESQPENWVAAHANLSVAYSDLHALTGSLDDEQAALDALGVALRRTDRELNPVSWAQLANNLGTLHLQRTIGNRAEILEEAIGYLQGAAQVQGRHGLLSEWARTQTNLAMAYRERVAGDRLENLEKSLACLGAALDALGDDHDPAIRARILLERAETLRYRIVGSRADNVELAYSDARLASELTGPAHGTLAWAEAQAELADVLRLRMAGSRAENLEEAIACYRQALACLDPAATPLRWALISTGLGNTLAERVRGERVPNLEEALEHLTGAAETLRDAPGAVATYAAVLASLGGVFLHRGRGDAASNAETAWRYLSEARDLEERLGMPRRTRAATLNQLGNASMARKVGDRDQHVEVAIACYELGVELVGPGNGELQVRLLSGLASAYALRPRGDRAANIARSLELDERVNSFRTRDMSPLERVEAGRTAGSVSEELRSLRPLPVLVR
jgi:tetratricopeptide (TPR) repeat protein